MLILGIETSCDETGVAVLNDGKILSDVVYSQDDVHSKYGGIVPELASRRHLETLIPALKSSLDIAGIQLNQIDLIAATRGPGLIGSLLTGLNFAKSIAFCLKKPIVGIDHIEAHILSAFIDLNGVALDEFLPFLGLCVSGGHTSLYLVKGIGQFILIGKTIDDAAGEAFDKVARALGLGYPGGPVIEKLSKNGNPDAIVFPKPKIKVGLFNFSFSGIKTAVINCIRTNPDMKKEDISSSFQSTVVKILMDKILLAMNEFKIKRVVVSGGVASNSHLRSVFKEGIEGAGGQIIYPPLRLCTDNGSMVAFSGWRYFKNGRHNSIYIDAYS